MGFGRRAEAGEGVWRTILMPTVDPVVAPLLYALPGRPTRRRELMARNDKTSHEAGSLPWMKERAGSMTKRRRNAVRPSSMRNPISSLDVRVRSALNS